MKRNVSGGDERKFGIIHEGEGGEESEERRWGGGEKEERRRGAHRWEAGEYSRLDKEEEKEERRGREGEEERAFHSVSVSASSLSSESGAVRR